MKNIVFTGRIVITGARKVKGQPNLEQYLIGGSMITLKGQPVTKSGNWEMIECDVVIIPKKIHRTLKEEYRTMRVDQVSQLLAKDSVWSDTEHRGKTIESELIS